MAWCSNRTTLRSQTTVALRSNGGWSHALAESLSGRVPLYPCRRCLNSHCWNALRFNCFILYVFLKIVFGQLSEKLVHRFINGFFEFTLCTIERALLLWHIRLLATHSLLKRTHCSHECFNHGAYLLRLCFKDVEGLAQLSVSLEWRLSHWLLLSNGVSATSWTGDGTLTWTGRRLLLQAQLVHRQFHRLNLVF